MHCKVSMSFFTLWTTTILNSIGINFALVAAVNDGVVLACTTAGGCTISYTYADVFAFLSSRESLENVTSPQISIHAIDGLFDVQLRESTRATRVSEFYMITPETESDIYLVNTSASLSIRCYVNGSQSKLSANIINFDELKPPMTKIHHSTQWQPYLETNSVFLVPNDELQSGHFTCSSIDERSPSATVRIFTQAGAIIGVSPFVSARESTIQADDTANGFIVPCRTNYGRKNPPNLLWAEHEQGHFYMLTGSKKKNFKWNPTLGFQFNNSGKTIWNTKTFACRLGSFNKTFLPSLNRFMNLFVVKTAGNRIFCQLVQRNDSNKMLVKSNIKLTAVRIHVCLTEIECDLHWKMGLLEHQSRYRDVDSKSEWNLELEFGVISCAFQHDDRVLETSYRKFFVGLDSNIYLLPGTYPNSSVIQISQVYGPFYKGQTELYHEFTCTIIHFVRSIDDSIYFILRYKNKTEIVYQRTASFNGARPSFVLKFNVTLDTEITHAICYALTNKGKVITAERPLQVLGAFAPLFENVEHREIIFNVGDLNDNHTLVCPITGAPPPEYQWFFNEKNTNLLQGINTRNLTFRQIDEDTAGTYACTAWNEHGNNSFEFQVSVESKGFFSTLTRTTIAWIFFGTLLAFIGVSAAIIFACKYFRAKRQMRNLTPEEAFEFLNGIPILGEPPHSQHGDGSELALHLPFTKRIGPNALTIARDLILGKGQFGVVYQGILDAETVAVKTFKRAVTYDEFRASLVEVKLMEFVGEHPNIVRFIGADVTNIERREILIVMELSAIGSLEKHLRMLKSSKPHNYINTTQYATIDERLILEKLFGFCGQIAFAMEHLENKKVIHGDLAARNVLVFSHGVVKVTDFGYSRQLYDSNMYKPKKNCTLPWRSASIELLRHMEFSTESDIWAFGVTVWEIFTFGSVPFASVRYSDQFVDSMEKGLRLKKPSGLSQPQYSFLMECWNLEKSGRPRFSILKSFFWIERENLRHGFENSEIYEMSLERNGNT